jgi:hypothetical protein
MMVRLQYSIAALLMSLGIGVACLPDAWIEARFGISPDGGNDLVEILLAAVPITLGLAIGLATFMHGRQSVRSGTSARSAGSTE